MANPSMFGKSGGGNYMLIPTLISIGLEFFTSRKAASNIEAMAGDMMWKGIMRESKYTGTMEGNLQRQRDRYESLFKIMFEGMPKDPTMEKIFGPEKDYGFLNEGKYSKTWQEMSEKEKREYLEETDPGKSVYQRSNPEGL